VGNIFGKAPSPALSAWQHCNFDRVASDLGWMSRRNNTAPHEFAFWLPGHEGKDGCICNCHGWGGLKEKQNPSCPASASTISNRGSDATSAATSAAANATPSRGNAAGGRHATSGGKAQSSSSQSLGNNYLSTYEQQHPWAFGAFAELIQNSDDAGSNQLNITYSHADKGLPEMLMLSDDGTGMTAAKMNLCLQIGSSEYERADDNTISGQYGVGFKQGVLRLGHTALVISRSEDEETISFGVLSNQPYMPSAQRYGVPLCKHTTLTLGGIDCVD